MEGVGGLGEVRGWVVTVVGEEGALGRGRSAVGESCGSQSGAGEM